MLSVRQLVLLANVAALAVLPMSSPAVTVARDGRSRCTIALAEQATATEKTAAAELAKYLGRITGGAFDVKVEKQLTGPENTNVIYVGHTKYAGQNGIEPVKLHPEEWIIKTVGSNLIITGGLPRGTLYAAYHFLEDIAGVRWWSPWEESIPAKRTFEVSNLNLRGKPFFRYRDIFTLYGNDEGLFAIRNRLNRQGDARIAPEYGGSMEYGPPYHAHTFYMYIEPARYFKEHPEWFSLIKGRRTAEKAQLCLTNAKLRETFLRTLKGFIEKAKSDAAAANLPSPKIFDISQNDWAGHCRCDSCQAIVRREGGEAGPLLDFVNYMANGIRGHYPDVYIDTVAYQHTEQPPRTLRASDNVIVRLCNSGGNLTRSIAHSDNTRFRELLAQWAKVSKNLHIWNYAITFDRYYGLPLPTAQTYADDYRYFAQSGIKGVFVEHERPVVDDMRDFKIWMMMKYLENPDLEYKNLANIFTDGYYGPAGKLIREYLTLLEQASNTRASYIKFYSSLEKYRYLTPNFIRDAQAVFDRAEKSVSDDPVLSRRVRHARLSLDRAALLVPGTGFNRELISRRYLQTAHEQVELRIPLSKAATEKQKLNEELKKLLAY